MQKITVTRALAEIKLLQKRIENGTAKLSLVGIKQDGKMKGSNSSYEVEAFEKQAKESLQSVMDLIERLTLIKTAIDQSNAVTKVKIGTKEMTIQEALVEKKLIEHKKELLSTLKGQKSRINREYELFVDRVQGEINTFRENLSTNKDTKASEIEDLCNKMLSVKNPELVDPCKLTDLIESLEKEIDDFENNVDYALSESNSVTYVEV